MESGIDLIRRQEVRAEAAAVAVAEVESRVDRALQRNKDATRSGVGAGLGLLLRGSGVVVMTVIIGIRSGAGGALEVDPILVLLLEDVGILVADLSYLQLKAGLLPFNSNTFLRVKLSTHTCT